MATETDILSDPKHIVELDFVIDRFNELPNTQRVELAKELQGSDTEKYAIAGCTIMNLLMESSGTLELLEYVSKKLNLAVELSFYHIVPDVKQLNARANFLAMYFRKHLREENGTVIIDSVPIPKVQTSPFSRKNL